MMVYLQRIIKDFLLSFIQLFIITSFNHSLLINLSFIIFNHLVALILGYKFMRLGLLNFSHKLSSFRNDLQLKLPKVEGSHYNDSMIFKI